MFADEEEEEEEEAGEEAEADAEAEAAEGERIDVSLGLVRYTNGELKTVSAADTWAGRV